MFVGGFLLAVAFQSRFEDLTRELVVHYLMLVGLAGLATLLGLAPVAVHRLLFGRRVKAATVLLGGRLLVATLVVVVVNLALEFLNRVLDPKLRAS